MESIPWTLDLVFTFELGSASSLEKKECAEWWAEEI